MKNKVFIMWAVVIAVVMTMTGCVKVVRIGEEGSLTGKVEFNAGDSVAGIWDQVVSSLTQKAVNLPDFLEEANGDLKSLAEKYGKYSMGTTGEISYVVKGSGVVAEVNQDKKAGYILLIPDGYEGTETIKLQIGAVYKGASVRDSLDFIAYGDYTNQNEWAAVSQELHKLIDEKVIQPIEPASLTGQTIEFIGTFTVNGNDELIITPVSLRAR